MDSTVSLTGMDKATLAPGRQVPEVEQTRLPNALDTRAEVLVTVRVAVVEADTEDVDVGAVVIGAPGETVGDEVVSIKVV